MRCLLRKVRDNSSTQRKIAEGQDFAEYFACGSHIYSVVFQVVKNVTGNPGGYLVGVTFEPKIEWLANQYKTYFVVTALILLAVFVYRGFLNKSLQDKSKLQNMLQSFFDNNLVGMAVIDADGNFLRVNQRATKMTGYDEDELLLMNSSTLTHPDDLNTTSYSDLLSSNNTGYSLRKRFVCKDGSILWGDVSAIGIYADSGQLNNVVGMVVDVTKKKQAEDALRQYRHILMSVDDHIAFIDRDYRYRAVSKGYMKNYQLTIEDIIGRSVTDLLGAHKFELEVKNLLERCFEGEYIKYQNWFEFKGEQKFFDVTYYPYSETDGTITGVVVNAHDITAHKNNLEAIAQKQRDLEQLNATLEHRINEATLELQNSNRDLRNLSKRMELIRENERKHIAREVHDDIGQMLVAFKFSLAQLNAQICSTPESSSTMATMEEQVAYLMQRVSDIVSELRPTILDDLGLYNAICWKAEEFSKQTSIRFNVTASKIPSLSKEHEVALFRIAQEALTNILRHAQASKITIDFRMEDNVFVFEITDNGHGITEKQRIAPDSFGIMGMTERAEQINGTLEITTHPYGGTIVRVKLPQVSMDKYEQNSCS